MVDRLLINIDAEGRAAVSVWLAGEQFPKPVGEPVEIAWPMDEQALEDLRWYLEDYLRVPFGVYSDRGTDIAAKLPVWGEGIFEAVFGSVPARAAYEGVRARKKPVEIWPSPITSLAWWRRIRGGLVRLRSGTAGPWPSKRSWVIGLVWPSAMDNWAFSLRTGVSLARRWSGRFDVWRCSRSFPILPPAPRRMFSSS